ncbi:MAG TPA: 16S rRNA (guanine(527)-N(7))-methyltransferase RsmG [Rhizobiaceae bacterium]|nr:16S rRNA (guanine(527)-N(7))-methyltransferase RsmG [Rhizobiaceae bacterium]
MTAPTLESLTRVAGPVSRETFDRLLAFEREFRRWSARINLAAPSTLPGLWQRHILDSAQLAPLAPAAHHWLDLGSGGGFPGAVMAILLAERPGTRVDLVESNKKKAAFLKTVLGGLGVQVFVWNERIEAAVGLVPKPEIVTARALASLGDLLKLAEPWLAKGARGLFHKGRDYRAEVKESLNHWRFDLVEHPSVTESGAVILEISRLSRR